MTQELFTLNSVQTQHHWVVAHSSALQTIQKINTDARDHSENLLSSGREKAVSFFLFFCFCFFDQGEFYRLDVKNNPNQGNIRWTWQGCSAWYQTRSPHIPPGRGLGFSLGLVQLQVTLTGLGNAHSGEAGWCKLVRCVHEPCVLYFPHVRDKQHTVVEISMQE